jgi:uncharacterized alpha-E superfamily protein
MLLSRVAEQLYWAARYLERAEGTARVVAEHTNLLVDLPTSVPLTWEPLLTIPGMRTTFDERYDAADERSIIRFLLSDRENPSSVLAAVTSARENMRSAREVLPREAWQALNDQYLYVASHHLEGVDRRSRGRFLDKVIAENRRFVGILAGSMSRDPAYCMLMLGQNVERADMTTRVLDVRAVALLTTGDETRPAHEDIQWAAVLRSLCAQQAYHSRVRAPIDGRLTVDFLLRDPDFPGSIRHCLSEIETVLGELPRAEAPLAAARAASRTLEKVAGSPLDVLHDGLDDVELALATVHGEVAGTYFAADDGFGASGESRPQ